MPCKISSRFDTSRIQPATAVESETAFGQSASVGTSTDYARDDHTHGTPDAGNGGLVTWVCRANIIAPQNNPTATSWVYAQRIYVPHDFRLVSYGYGMARAGVKTDGYIYLSAWTDDAANNCPGEEYESARVFVYPYGKAVGWNRVALQALGVSTVTLSAGYNWLISTIERHDGLGRTEAPIDWQDGGAAGYGHALAIEIPGSAGWPSGTWDSAGDEPVHRVPLIYAYDT